MKTDKIKVRKSWGNTNPVTKKINSKKVYSRKTKHVANWGDPAGSLSDCEAVDCGGSGEGGWGTS